MRSSILSLVCLVFLLGMVTSASAWLPFAEEGALEKRAETTADATSSEDASATASHESTETADKTASDKTATGTSTDSKTNTKSDSKTTATSSVSINPAAGAGIGHNVTFAWNYTSLTISPSAVDVVASCSANSATYTLTSNMTVKETGSVVWDTNATQTIPFLTATYTLFVVDSDKSLGDTAEAGHLGSQIGFNFGMYWPQKATPLNKFLCATCNGAISEAQRQGLKFAFGMAAITIATFTWFSGSFGLFAI
ncbi:hypothetical protein N7512_010461 [Penicillium capsulatum]|nr:hypothetical protein N7512_010461 [Penicillium capsulatum]